MFNSNIQNNEWNFVVTYLNKKGFEKVICVSEKQFNIKQLRENIIKNILVKSK